MFATLIPYCIERQALEGVVSLTAICLCFLLSLCPLIGIKTTRQETERCAQTQRQLAVNLPAELSWPPL